MKYIQFAIMAVMLFGLAASPAFSNGLAFAGGEEPDCTPEDRAENGCEAQAPDTVGASSKTTPQKEFEQEEQASDKDESDTPEEPRDTPTECTKGVDAEEEPESTKDCPNRNSSSN